MVYGTGIVPLTISAKKQKTDRQNNGIGIPVCTCTHSKGTFHTVGTVSIQDNLILTVNSRIL